MNDILIYFLFVAIISALYFLFLKLSKIEKILKKHSFLDYKNNEINDLDELFNESVKIIQNYDKVSASLIQRKLALGYNRSARIIDQMCEKELVSHINNSTIKHVLHDKVKNYLKTIK